MDQNSNQSAPTPDFVPADNGLNNDRTMAMIAYIIFFIPLVAVSKRSNQISTQIKEELTQKLQEFATSTDSLEEIFENREQIEISKHYEKMPKSTAIAMQELLDDKIHLRNPEEDAE